MSCASGLWFSICLLVLYALAELSDEVLEQEAFAFDKAILLYLHQHATPMLDALMIHITRLADPKTVVPIAIAVFLFLRWRHHRLEARFFALNALGGVVLSYGLKLIFNKPRPQLWSQMISEESFSYPSGHALGSVVIYGFLAHLLAYLYPPYCFLFYGIAGVLIVAIGFSRLYLGVHWPTDVLAGYGVGFLWVSVCLMLMRLQKIKDSDPA
ncbi:phosphatase PAP2 family protein [Lyngbya confervoides]|uniref:Phosphatase PAP2 family protein n=1 Tax=Lyngbya confervoides BDU141951 TaxID=1574623 RepID=A0ABD4T5T3_9CYAN|nr:phosphatase PAP2 family protein [Lyngbya confervoides]MCM1983902.1 phosphatase PAP2 family protein [Lyngbya confervoides BDU141951]